MQTFVKIDSRVWLLALKQTLFLLSLSKKVLLAHPTSEAGYLAEFTPVFVTTTTFTPDEQPLTASSRQHYLP